MDLRRHARGMVCDHEAGGSCKRRLVRKHSYPVFYCEYLSQVDLDLQCESNILETKKFKS